MSTLVRLMRRVRPEVVHTHTAKAGTVGRLAAIAYNYTAGRRRPAGVVHTYHGHVFEGDFTALEAVVFVRSSAGWRGGPTSGRDRAGACATSW